MLDIEVHEGLTDKILRNYFMTSLANNLEQEIVISDDFKKQKSLIYLDPLKNKPIGYLERAIAINKSEVEFYIKNGHLLYQKLALFTLMAEKGWKEWDTSDHTQKTGSQYINFIGTEDEYNTLIEKINNE